MKNEIAKYIFALFISYLFTTNINAIDDNYSFKHLSTDNRLPGTYIHNTFQDHNGLIWFAIESSGLCKYDGKNFIVYEYNEKDPNSISNNTPLCIVEDSVGYIWVGTTNGLNRFNRATNQFTRYYNNGTDECIPDDYVKDLHVDHLNNIWIATRGGLSKYIPAQNRFYNLLIGEKSYTDGLPGVVSSIYEDPEGNIWIGSYSSGLFLIDKDNNRNHNKGIDSLNISKHWFPELQNSKNETNFAVQQICKYDKQNLLLGKIDGLYLFNTETEIFSKYYLSNNPQLNYSTVSALHKDNEGRFWVGYADEGMIFIDNLNHKEIYFNTENYREKGIKDNSIRDIYEDQNGLIWIATKFDGVHIYDPRQEILTKNHFNDILCYKIGEKFILSIIEGSNKNIWIGTKKNGVYMFDPIKNTLINFSSDNIAGKDYISNNRVECIYEDHEGSIWAGTMNGVHRLKASDKNFQKLNDYYIRCLTGDKNGNIWIGTNSSGILFYDTISKKINRYQSSHESFFFSRNDLLIKSIFLDGDSSLWMSTSNNGLFKYNFASDQITRYFSDSSVLKGVEINKLYRDKSGELWAVSVADGLLCFDTNKNKFVKIKSEKVSLPNTINNMEQDDNGVFWMGTNKGILKYEPTLKKSTIFDSKYGLNSLTTEINALCLTSNNLILAGGSEGLNVFSTNDTWEKKYNTRLIISNVKIYDDIIAEDIVKDSSLMIDHDKKFISIEFALTDYIAPLQVQYAYMLENFDKNWIECNNNNKAIYTALPPGTYFFKVKTLNYDTPPSSLKLTIKGPLWQKPYFIIFFVIIFLSMGVFVHFTRLRIIKRREIKLNQLINEKTHDLIELNLQLEENKSRLEEALIKAEESDKLKIAFLANLSHEIRTPMNGIIGFTELLRDKELDTYQKQKYINIIRKSSKRMLRIIQDLIDISKIESNQIQIIPEKNNIIKILTDIYDFFKLETDSKNIEFVKKIEIPEENAFITCDKTRIEQVLTNLITNAIKFTSKGTITIGCTKRTDEILIYVKDMGKGIPDNKKEIIFERFMQINEENIYFPDGSGLGLSISKALIELHGGTIWVDSQIEKGSTFYFTLPLHPQFTTTKEQKEKENKGILIKNLKGKRVLVVEDDKYSYLLLREILTTHKLEVFYAKNGEEAVKIISSKQYPDIILMDIKMPRLNGLKAAKKIKTLNKDIPIILQSAFIQVLNAKRNNIYVDGFLSKPINQEKLIKILNEHLN